MLGILPASVLLLTAQPGDGMLRFVDVTGDGVVDRLTVGSGGAIEVAVQTPGRHFVAIRQDLAAAGVNALLVDDLNSDGFTDVYVVSSGPNLTMLGDGSGHFVMAPDGLGLSDDAWGLSAQRLDADGDGLLDVLLQNRHGEVLFWAVAGGHYVRETSSAAMPPADAWRTPNGDSRLEADLNQNVVERLDLIFVRDDVSEVDALDVTDGSLLGADVSTSSGDVAFANGSCSITDGGLKVGSYSGSARVGIVGADGNAALGVKGSGSDDNRAPGVAIEASGGTNFDKPAGAAAVMAQGGAGNNSGAAAIQAKGGAALEGPGGPGLMATGGFSAFSFTPPPGIRAIGGTNEIGAFGRAIEATGDVAVVGRVSIGPELLAPAFDLHVNGTAGKPGGGSWSVASDARLKRNVAPLEGALDKLLALHGVTFEYIDPAAIGELSGERMGLVAQEVEQVFPDWVSEGPDGYKRLTERGFTALTIEALRELRSEQQEEIAALRAELDGLQGARSVPARR